MNSSVLKAKYKSDEVQNERQNDENKCEPFGHLRKLRVKGLVLTLGEESLGAAGDRARKTGALAALHEHDNGDSKT